MAAAIQRLADQQQLSDTAAAIVTNAALHRTVINHIHLFNTDDYSHTVTIYRVPDATGSVGTAATANEFDSIAVAANSSEEWTGLIVLQDTNDTLQMKADVASMVNVSVDGQDIT